MKRKRRYLLISFKEDFNDVKALIKKLSSILLLSQRELKLFRLGQGHYVIRCSLRSYDAIKLALQDLSKKKYRISILKTSGTVKSLRKYIDKSNKDRIG